MIRFECPHCNQPVEVGDEFAGRKGRCPGCESVVEIPVPVRPQGAQPAGPDAPDRGGESLLADDLGGRGPRKLTLPESVATVTTEQPVRRMTSVGRPMAVSGLILGFIPLLSIVGIVVGGIAWSQAAGGGTRRTRRLAIAATVLSIVMTFVSIGLGFVALVSVFQHAFADEEAEQCRNALTTLATELDDFATDHDGRYPASLGDLSAPSMHFFGSSPRHCPDTDTRYGYVPGLKPDPSGTDRTIVLHDRKPAHGVKAWLWSRPPGRNVYRLSGDVEFLPEEAFQREIDAQRKRLGPPGAAGP